MKRSSLFLSIALAPLFLWGEGLYRQLLLPLPFPLNLFQKDQTVHLIEVDPSLYEIRLVRAFEEGLGRESLLSMSERYGAVGGVNGGFFAIGGVFDGLPRGALKIGSWRSLPLKPRGCIGWSSDGGAAKLDRLVVTFHAFYEGSSFLLDGLNRKRGRGDALLFTPSFHERTLTEEEGEEVVVCDGIIKEIVRGKNSPIPEEGAVLSIGFDHPLYGAFEVGRPLSFFPEISPLLDRGSSSLWGSFDSILGGGPLLLHQSVKVEGAIEEIVPSFLERRYARTAVGILPNGHWLFVVVDQENFFGGLSIDGLADLMGDLGCVEALNLDGGGSSTMVYEGKVQNHPRGDRDEGEGERGARLLSDAILILSKNRQ